MALQPKKGLGPILNAIDIIVAGTQQKRRELRQDTIRREGFEREDRQRLQSGKIGALGKIFGIKGIDPAQKQKAFETIIDTIGNPETDVGGFDITAREEVEEEPRFGLSPETEEIFPTLAGQDFDLPEFFKIQDQRTKRQRADDARTKLKDTMTRARKKKDTTKKDTARKDFVKNLNEFKQTLTDESKRITEKDLTGKFAPVAGQEDRFKELQTDTIPELEKLERTVSGFRSTSIDELEAWVERGWIEKDMLRELLEENGLTEEFILKNNAAR